MRIPTTIIVTLGLVGLLAGCAVGGHGDENNNNFQANHDAATPPPDAQPGPDSAAQPDAAPTPDGGCPAGYTGPDCDECDTGYLECGSFCVDDCGSCSGQPSQCGDACVASCAADCPAAVYLCDYLCVSSCTACPGKPALCEGTGECLVDCSTCSGTCTECGENEHPCPGGCHPDVADIPSAGCRLTCDDQPCPEPAHATAVCTDGMCDFTCDAAGHFVESGGACVCDAAGHFVESGGACVCDAAGHFVESGGACVCDAAGHWVASGSACECDTGYTEQGGQCVPDSTCPGTVSGSYCYFYVSTSVTWDAAETDCVAQGGHLASITDAAENAVVQGVAGADCWIGLRDHATSSQSIYAEDCTDNAWISADGGRYTGTTVYNDIDICTSSGSEEDILHFTAAVSQVYVFATNGSNFDTVLGLFYHASDTGYTGCVGSEIECNDDDGPGSTSLIIRYLSAGDYTVVVDGYWSGGDYVLQVRRFQWSDGTVHGWANWSTDEPNNAGANEYCGMLYQSTGLWNDAECTATRPYVCKRLD